MAEEGRHPDTTDEDKAIWWRTVKRRMSFVDADATRPNWNVILLCTLCSMMVDVVSTTSAPFIPEMVRSFGYSEEDKGYYAGIVGSSLIAGRIISSLFWGWLADAKGAKIVIVLNVGFMCVFSLVFGFTNSFAMAIAVRFITGVFLSGIPSATKSALYDTSDNTNQAVGMSFATLGWGISLIISPLIGGYLSSPAEKYPQIFDSAFMRNNPYFLSYVIVAFGCLILLILIICRFPRSTSSSGLELDISAEERSETDLEDNYPTSNNPFLAKTDVAPNTDSLSKRFADGTKKQIRYNALIELRALSASLSSSSAGLCASNLSINHFNFPKISKQSSIILVDANETHENGGTDFKNVHLPRTISHDESSDCESRANFSSFCLKLKQLSIIRLLSVSDYRLVLIVYSTLMVSTGFHETFAIFASTDVNLDGLGFSSVEIGLAFIMLAIPLTVAQTYLTPFLVRKWGIIKTARLCVLIQIVTITACPMTSLLADRPTVLWTVLAVLLIPHKIAEYGGYSCFMMLILNSVPIDLIGVATGCLVFVVSIERTAGIAVGGSIFAWSISYAGQHISSFFNVNFVFFLYGMFAWVSLVTTLWLPEHLNRQKK